MAQMSAKEARRRGMTTKTSYPRSPDVNANMFVSRDVNPREVARYDGTPIMFGGLGNVNWFGNEPESKVTGGQNMYVNGLYGVGVTEEDELAYLGSVEHVKDPDFYLGGGLGLALGALALFALKYQGKI
tara:strand:+ start:4846 stop:5232 length:387 start_codon:yes stop_codon:yes gene_type:complete